MQTFSMKRNALRNLGKVKATAMREKRFLSTELFFAVEAAFVGAGHRWVHPAPPPTMTGADASSYRVTTYSPFTLRCFRWRVSELGFVDRN